MRNETKSSSVPARSTPLGSSRRTPPANAFSQAYLLQAPPPEEVEGGPSGLSMAGGATWAGPWAVEPVGDSCGRLWAVSRLAEPVAEGGEPVAAYRDRRTALVYAAALPSLATANHLRVGDNDRRLGRPVHDGERCIGHVSRPHPEVLHRVHAVRSLVNDPRSLALALSALDREELAILGRALMRQAA